MKIKKNKKGNQRRSPTLLISIWEDAVVSQIHQRDHWTDRWSDWYGDQVLCIWSMMPRPNFWSESCLTSASLPGNKSKTMMMINAFFKMISFRNGNRCKYGGSCHKSSSLRVTQHMPMFSPGWRLVSRQRGCVTLSHCDILAGDHLHIFGYYCTVAVSVFVLFCSFLCKGIEAGIPCWKVERRPIRHFLRLWPESAKSSGDLIRPFFPCQPGAYRWGLINCAISRLSCSQDSW